MGRVLGVDWRIPAEISLRYAYYAKACSPYDPAAWHQEPDVCRPEHKAEKEYTEPLKELTTVPQFECALAGKEMITGTILGDAPRVEILKEAGLKEVVLRFVDFQNTKDSLPRVRAPELDRSLRINDKGAMWLTVGLYENKCRAPSAEDVKAGLEAIEARVLAARRLKNSLNEAARELQALK